MREVVYLKNIIQNIRVYFVYIRDISCIFVVIHVILVRTLKLVKKNKMKY